MPKSQRLRDQDARDAIVQHLDVNMLIEASAGSGKTESLAMRMAAGISAGIYTVEHMAAVTFTRKAAAELRGRFQLHLERALTKAADPQTRARLDEALSRLEHLFAGTFHAFCAQLIQERPVEAGVSPGFSQLEEGEDARLRQQLWRQFIEEERSSQSPNYEAVLHAGLTPTDLDDALSRLCTFPDVTFPPGEAVVPDAAPLRRAFEDFWGRLSVLVPDDIPDAPDCALLALIQSVRQNLLVMDLQDPREVATLLNRWEKPPTMTQKYWPGTPGERKALKSRLEAMIEPFVTGVVHPFLQAWRQYVYRISLELLLKGRAYVVERRRRALMLNYEDLLQVVAKLLRARSDVRQDLQEKYCWLFVDEFQDTDPLQAEILLLLACEPASEINDWTSVTLRPGGLFIVGDPKQSIYRFRRADIDTYQRVRHRIRTTGGEVVSLTASFRSTGSLCDWTNEVFQRVLPHEATPQQPAFEGLYPASSEAASGPHVVKLTSPATMGESQIVSSEAATIAAYIQAEIDAGRRQPGDFLVLTRKRRALERYAAALEAVNLPVEVSGGSTVSESPYVGVFLLLLRVSSDPDDGPAVIGVLRGPLFGISDVELFSHRQAGGCFLLTAPLPEQALTPVQTALGVLRQMYHWTRTLPAGAALDCILERTGLLALAMTHSPCGAEAAALLQAVDGVRMSTERGDSLATATALLEDAVGERSIETLPLEPGLSNVVRVMNLHKAKGLEAPVVFLADPLGGVKPTVDLRITRDQESIGYLKLTRPKGEWAREVIGLPPGWDAHEAAEQAYVEAEEDRLLYVACTRAKERLIVSRWAKDGGRGSRPWGKLEPFLLQAPELELPSNRRTANGRAFELDVSLARAATHLREERHEAVKKPSYQVASVTAISSPGGMRSESLETGPATGVAWGTLIHALLEQLARQPGLSTHDLTNRARWHSRDNEELLTVVPQAIETIERIRNSDFWREVQSATVRLAEVPFSIKPNDGPTPTILSGVIDLLYRTERGWHVVDYKTDQLSLDELAASYREQCQAYATQWASIVGEPVAYAGLYSIRLVQLSPNLVQI
ncbi:MAG: UvrD-helicase domain-containing protein [Nitrospira sp. BO4]|jgi:ATP-dependent helicase/nuclease subunit A|nr:UvrD-helicase domain-containing protein [Nitrospira sp. BO4]